MNTERKTYQKLDNTAQAAAQMAPASYAELLTAARAAIERAYAPYSDFQVGAALLSEDGRVFTGCNVEVCTYDGGICAERVAFVKAISEGASRFKAIAVVCRRANGSWPCGLCRQFMVEFGPDLDVVVEGLDGNVQTLKLKELLPRHFGPDALKK